LFGYIGLLSIFLQGGLIGRLIKKFGEPALVVAGFFSLLAGQVLLGFSYGVWSLVFASTVSAFGTGVIRPTLTSLISRYAGPGEQGVVLGLTQSLMSVASIVAPIVAGLLIERRLLTVWAWVPAVVAAVGLFLARDMMAAPASARAASAG